MPWNDQRGGGRGPWGQGPQGGGSGGGGGGLQPPDMDELLKQLQARLRGMFPGGQGQMGMLAIIIGAVVVGYVLFNSIYVVQATERGVVLRFGQYVDTISEGLHFRLPYPIETVERVVMTRQQINVGNATRTAQGSDDGLMLTGDESIVEIDFTVFWQVIDPEKYLFNVENVPGTIKAVAESAMREAVGQTPIDAILTVGRAKVQDSTRTTMQTLLNAYGAGVQITDVTLQNANPPEKVVEAFRDVQKAAADADRARNEADAYQNSKVPEARGQAEQIVQQAEAYKARAIAEARGEAARFTSIYEQYRVSPSITRERMFLETMERVLGPMNKIIIEGRNGQGAQPFISIPPELLRRQNPPANSSAQ